MTFTQIIDMLESRVPQNPLCPIFEKEIVNRLGKVPMGWKDLPNLITAKNAPCFFGLAITVLTDIATKHINGPKITTRILETLRLLLEEKLGVTIDQVIILSFEDLNRIRPKTVFHSLPVPSLN